MATTKVLNSNNYFHCTDPVDYEHFANSDEALEVEEGDILSFHFNNYTLRDFHVYIFCFEETGSALLHVHIMRALLDNLYL